MSSYTLFCPKCDQLLLGERHCKQCGWHRPQVKAGQEVGEPLPLNHTLSGRPAVMDEMVWYAAPPEQREVAGGLMGIRLDGQRVQYFDLTPKDSPSLPVTLSLAHSPTSPLLTLLDYALGTQRPLKAVMGLDPLLGEPAWKIDTPSRELGGLQVVGSEAYGAGDTPYAYGAGASPEMVYCFDLEQKKIRWQTPVYANFRTRPVVSGSIVVCSSGSYMTSAEWFALDRETGREVWRNPLSHHPSQMVAAGALVIVPLAKQLVAYTAATGQQVWHYDQFRYTSHGAVTTVPVVAGELLLICTGAGSKHEPRYEVQALKAQTGEKVWQFELPAVTPPAAQHILVPPAVFDQTVIVGDRVGMVYALELGTGRVQWQYKLSARLAAVPYVVGDVLYLPTRDGYLAQVQWQDLGRPPLTAKEYVQQGEWLLAGYAAALAPQPNLSVAAQHFMRAKEYEMARRLYQFLDDKAGEAISWAEQGEYDQAVAINQPNAEIRVEWLYKAQRFGDAGELLSELASQQEDEIYKRQLWKDAAEAFKEGHQFVKAWQAYNRGQWKQELQELSKVMPSDAKLAEQFEHQQQWEIAIQHRIKLGHWGRVWEISQAQGWWEQEVEACQQLAQMATKEHLARQWWQRAGEIYEGRELWEQGVDCFTKGEEWVKTAACLAQLGRLEEAGELLTPIDHRYPEFAAGYFEQAAGVAHQHWPERKRNPAGAQLYEKAAYWYGVAGNREAEKRCLALADKCLNRPRLVVRDMPEKKVAWKQGVNTQLMVLLDNLGHNHARQVEVWGGGYGLNCRTREEAILLKQPPEVIPAGNCITVTLDITPYHPSHEESVVSFVLWLKYRVGEEEQTQEDGPFEFAAVVYPNYLQQLPSDALNVIHIHEKGSFYSEGDQINTVRPGVV